jgi:CheY-like chemotaxis protein
MPGGGVITFASRLEGKWVVLEISDTGGGMTEETARRCFEPFYSTKGPEGTGMGLAMVYSTIKRCGGTIEVQSRLGEGTCFTLRLPAHDSEKKEKRKSRIPRKSNCRMSVLVVDDDESSCELLRRYLISDGHRVQTADSAQQALSKCRSARFDLVFTDRAMPQMNGDRLTAAVKRTTPETPVIMLTGFGEVMKDKGELPEGVDMILSKPVTEDHLRQAIGEIVLKNIARRQSLRK